MHARDSHIFVILVLMHTRIEHEVAAHKCHDVNAPLTMDDDDNDDDDDEPESSSRKNPTILSDI